MKSTEIDAYFFEYGEFDAIKNILKMLNKEIEELKERL